MSIETEIAKAGVKTTWQGIKVVVFAIIALSLAAAIAWMVWGENQRNKRLEGLEKFRSSWEQQQRVSAAADTAYTKAKGEATAQAAGQIELTVKHEYETEEARREDPTVDDFLSARIPERLRDADARARRSRRLEKD